MYSRRINKSGVRHAAGMLAVALLAAGAAAADEPGRDVFVLTSTNSPSANQLVVFSLETSGTPSLSMADMLPTQGTGGAGNNAGIVQFKGDLGAVANYGSNTVSRIVRRRNSIDIEGTIALARNCLKPDSLALTLDHLFVVGANCAESHDWPSGNVDGTAVALHDPSAAQIVVGKDWAAVTMTSGSLLQLPLKWDGALDGTSAAVTLPATADNTPLGAAFWGDVLGFTPAHSPDSFAIVNKSRDVFPITGPTPPYPTNAPCWVAKGPGNIWYTANSPGEAISIFLTDGQGGVFYKSIPLPGRRRTSRSPRIRSGSLLFTVPVAAPMSRHSPSMPTATSPQRRLRVPSVSPVLAELPSASNSVFGEPVWKIGQPISVRHAGSSAVRCSAIVEAERERQGCHHLFHLSPGQSGNVTTDIDLRHRLNIV